MKANAILVLEKFDLPYELRKHPIDENQLSGFNHV